MPDINFKAVVLHTMEAAVVLAAAFLVVNLFGSTSETKTWAIAIAMTAVTKLVRDLGGDYVNN